MKKRFAILFLALALCICTVMQVSAAQSPWVEKGKQVAADAAKMTFPEDGSDHTAVCPVCLTSQTWIGLKTEDVSGGITLGAKNVPVHYYLAESITADNASIGAYNGASGWACLHLNGKDLTSTTTVAISGSAGKLNVMGNGQVKGGKSDGATYGATMQINTAGLGGCVNLYGGTYGKVDPSSTASVFSIRPNGGIFNFFSGATIESGTNGSAVCINGDASLTKAIVNLYGAKIDASNGSKVAVNMRDAGKTGAVQFNMYAGEIIGGTGTTGGNVYIGKNTAFTMLDGTIKDGIATNGGNVYIAESGSLIMSGGTISGSRNANGEATGGSAGENGGNIYMTTKAVFRMTGGTIKDGTAVGEGGNIYSVGTGSGGFAQIQLNNATISGGKATSNGGNISILRSELIIEEGTRIENGVSAARAGSIRAYQATITMTGGTISGGSGVTGGTDNVWLAGSSALTARMYMLGGTVECSDTRHNTGLAIAANSNLYLGGAATVTDTNPNYAAISMSGQLYVCDGWRGSADIHFDKNYSYGATIPTSYAQVATLQEDLSVTVGGSFSGKLTHRYTTQADLRPNADGSLYVANLLLVSADGTETVATDALSQWKEGGYAYIKLCTASEFADLAGLDVVVDLSGYDLTVGGTGSLQAFDSANDTYNAAKCGTLTNNGSLQVATDVQAPNGNRYIAVTDGGKITMHRLEMDLTAVTLRTTAAGIYYKAMYECDEALSSKVERYGVVLSLYDMPGADFLTEWDENRYTVAAEAFQSGTVATSGSVFGIMKDVNTLQTNASNGEMKIYANPYICFDMGSDMIVVGDNKNPGKTADAEDFDGIAYSLHDTMDEIDDNYYLYSKSNRNDINAFYAQWKEKGMDWSFVNIGGEDKSVDNENLSFTEGANALCPVCNEEVTWTPVTQQEHGQTAIGAAASGSHYYLAEDIVYSGATSFIRAPGTGGVSCLHLNGHNLTAAGARAIEGYAGTLNVMGNGTVSGNVADENRGAAVQINTGGSKGVINLYGGTYVKPVTNTAASVIAIWNNGGKINLYEGATVQATGEEYAIYVGKASLVNAELGLHGANIDGGLVYFVAPDAKESKLNISGNAKLNILRVASMYVQINISGAPVIEGMYLIPDQLLTLGEMSNGADITVSALDAFTNPIEKAAEYVDYFRPIYGTDSIQAIDSALHYCITYSNYCIPWEFDAIQKAKDEQKIHYYFMASEGMMIRPNNLHEKWGDSCLVVFPNGQTMLIDSGTYTQAAVIKENLLRLGIDTLDYAITTHPHVDHRGIFQNPDDFFDKITVKQAYYNGTGTHTKATCEKLGIPLTILERGMTLDIGQVHMEVLWPEIGTSVETDLDVNDTSIVVRFDYGEHSSLFTGDIYANAEEMMLAAVGAEKLDADLLKVPHHGYNTSIADSFLPAVTPELAVATGRVEIVPVVATYYKNYNFLTDEARGFIHVQADENGNMTYETSR